MTRRAGASETVKARAISTICRRPIERSCTRSRADAVARKNLVELVEDEPRGAFAPAEAADRGMERPARSRRPSGWGRATVPGTRCAGRAPWRGRPDRSVAPRRRSTRRPRVRRRRRRSGRASTSICRRRCGRRRRRIRPQRQKNRRRPEPGRRNRISPRPVKSTREARRPPWFCQSLSERRVRLAG